MAVRATSCRTTFSTKKLSSFDLRKNEILIESAKNVDLPNFRAYGRLALLHHSAVFQNHKVIFQFMRFIPIVGEEDYGFVQLVLQL